MKQTCLDLTFAAADERWNESSYWDRWTDWATNMIFSSKHIFFTQVDFGPDFESIRSLQLIASNHRRNLSVRAQSSIIPQHVDCQTQVSETNMTSRQNQQQPCSLLNRQNWVAHTHLHTHTHTHTHARTHAHAHTSGCWRTRQTFSTRLTSCVDKQWAPQRNSAGRESFDEDRKLVCTD